MVQTSDLMVGAQVLASAALAWPGRARWHQPTAVTVAGLTAAAAGGTVALAGLRAQGRQITPRVEPLPDAVLLTEGVYALSRYPVYAGMLLAGAGWALARRRPEPLAAWAALAGVLHLKSGLEDQVLRERFGPAWTSYAARTPRLLGLPAR